MGVSVFKGLKIFKGSKKKKSKSRLRGSIYRKLKGKNNIIIPKSRAGYILNLTKQKDIKHLKFRIYPRKGVLSLPIHKGGDFKGVLYPLMRPFAYANIKWDENEHSLVYHVIEPKLTDKERNVFEKLKDGLIQVINVKLTAARHEAKTLQFLEENIKQLIDYYGYKLAEQEYLKIIYYIYRDFIGLNEIEPLMRDPYIEDIGCDGSGLPIYVVHQRYGSIKTNILFQENDPLREFVTKLAERCDRYISYAEPLLDGSLPDGSRVQASFAADVTTRGPTFSIRKFREAPFTPIDMIRLNTASLEMLAYLWFIIEHGANILIAGGVATGKTSILNALSLFIPTEAKIVSIEDTRELSLPHENWIPSVARTSFGGTGVGEVSMFDLLRESFRQNPDYLIVGEIRGKEAYVMFQAMASGHPSLSTMHGGSVDDVMKRLQTKPIDLSPGLLESLDIVITMVHAREKGKSARRVKEVIEIQGVDVDTGHARISKIFVWLPAVDTFEYRSNSWMLNKIATEKGIAIPDIIRDITRRKKMLKWMIDQNINTMKDTEKYIRLYTRDPSQVEHLIEGVRYEEA